VNVKTKRNTGQSAPVLLCTRGKKPCEYAVQASHWGTRPEGASAVRCCPAKPSPALEAAARFLQGFKTLPTHSPNS
jgi:hypothetical protein